uniref:Uncharacterized protein n=1 Tax=Oryza sativa subsp. japonica TaxID=39947 RepID=Q6Z3T2_ORYSJ|nr:hypothetical protein [Oryza sativa Japonica Group]BAD10171.1 hypothetical protein [Oryza sativa Japonica Group]
MERHRRQRRRSSSGQAPRCGGRGGAAEERRTGSSRRWRRQSGIADEGGIAAADELLNAVAEAEWRRRTILAFGDKMRIPYVDGVEDSGGGICRDLPLRIEDSAPFRGYSLHATLARRCAPAAASLALYSHIREASPPTPFIFSLLLAALASSSSPPSYPSAGFACLAAVCVAHAQAFKCNVLAHPIITPPDGAMEIAAVYDDCACARAVEVHRQEEYVVAGRRRSC